MRALVLAALTACLWSLAATADDSSLSLLEVSCALSGQSYGTSIWLGTRASQIQVGADKVVVTGKSLQFTGAVTTDADSEYDVLGEARYTLGEAKTFSCDRSLISFRLIGHDQMMDLDMLFQSLPFQEGCIDADQAYKTCPDQRVAYQAKLNEALRAQKLVMVVDGYTGCDWCDNLYRTIELTSLGAPVRDQFVRDYFATSRATNRTGKALELDLESKTTVGDKMAADVGVPVLWIVNPVNGKVAGLSLEKFEWNEDYHRQQVIDAISQLAGQVR